MSEAAIDSKETSEESVLDPVSRACEILFGLIMVLTFTCTLSLTSERADVREMLIGALTCNVAWGIIDAFFYLITIAAQRGHERVLVGKLKDAPTQESARKLFQHVIPESVIGSLSAGSFAEIRAHLLKNSAHPMPLVTLGEIKAALIIFVLVFLTTFPVALPFLFLSSLEPALRISNLIALLLLFGIGFSLGHYAGRRPLFWGLAMTAIGAILVVITIALGG